MIVREGPPPYVLPIVLEDSEGLEIPEALCLWQMAPLSIVGFLGTAGSMLVQPR